MTKNIFIYLVIVIVVGVAVWFFVDKARNASDSEGLGALVNKTEESASPPPSEQMTEETNEWITLDNGLKIMDTQIGYGREARSGDMIAANYTGTLADGTKFDSSYDRGQPFAFVLGGGMVIQGWDTGIVGMKVGGKRKLIIPPELGYGDKEVSGGIIPANSTLYFDVELMDAKDFNPAQQQ